jgi:hypothetical protein
MLCWCRSLAIVRARAADGQAGRTTAQIVGRAATGACVGLGMQRVQPPTDLKCNSQQQQLWTQLPQDARHPITLRSCAHQGNHPACMHVLHPCSGSAPLFTDGAAVVAVCAVPCSPGGDYFLGANPLNPLKGTQDEGKLAPQAFECPLGSSGQRMTTLGRRTSSIRGCGKALARVCAACGSILCVFWWCWRHG